jgi:hypothetical protein
VELIEGYLGDSAAIGDVDFVDIGGNRPMPSAFQLGHQVGPEHTAGADDKNVHQQPPSRISPSWVNSFVVFAIRSCSTRSVVAPTLS